MYNFKTIIYNIFFWYELDSLFHNSTVISHNVTLKFAISKIWVEA